MKPIKLAKENEAAIEAALKAVNGRASTHAWTTLFELEKAAFWAEKRLERLELPKAVRPGARFVAQSGETLPNAYKYQATTTTVELLRRGAGWYLVDAMQSGLYPKATPRHVLTLTPAQDAKAIEVLRRDYLIAEGTDACVTASA
jgi:hypothetical protein